MVVKKFVRVFLYLGLMLCSLQAFAEADKRYVAITDILVEVAELNQQIFLNEDETKLAQLIKNKDALFERLMMVIHGSSIDYDIESISKPELQMLNSKIRINRARGNTLAVQRDRFSVDYYLTRRDIAQFVVLLVESSRAFQSKEQIIKEVESRIVQLNKKIKTTAEPLKGEAEIYQKLTKNHQDLMRIYAVYLDFLDYVKNNPEEVIATSFFSNISLISAISYFNNIEVFTSVNSVIAPLRIDMGGLIVSLCIFLLTMITYPIVFQASNRLIERFILNDGKVDNMEIVFLSLHKPLLYFLFLFGVDLSMNALLYKTEYKAVVDHFIYIFYQGLCVYLLFNLIDSVVAVQFDRADKRNKELSRELVLLMTKSLKGIVVLLSLTLILSHFGINITAILSTLGIGGLAFAMAAKDSLSNFFGGLNIMVDHIFKMGDWIKIGDVEGTVVEIGLRSTTVRTFDNALITMPNAMVSTASVLNWNRRSVGRRIKMHVGVTYESNINDIRQAVADIKQMLEQHADIASSKEAHTSNRAHHKYLKKEDLHGIKSTQLVFLDRYGDFSIDILIYCFSKTVDWAKWLEVKEDVLFQIADILQKNNLSFAYPTNVQINRNEVPEEVNLGGILSE